MHPRSPMDSKRRVGYGGDGVRDDGPSQVNVGPELVENVEVFAQIDDASGRVLRSTPLIARSQLLSAAQALLLRRVTPYDRTVPGNLGLRSGTPAVPGRRERRDRAPWRHTQPDAGPDQRVRGQ